MTHKSSRRWLREHFSDPYVKQAQKTGLRSRAVYKLQEIQQRDQIFKPGMVIIEIGAAPGGWTEFIKQQLGKKGRLIAIDVLPMEPIEGVEFIQGDFCEEHILQELIQRVALTGVDWVVSDLAPNMSGIPSVDQARSMRLAELVFDFTERVIKPEGGLLIKVFQGEAFDTFLVNLRRFFKKVVIRKPKASRDRSREVYVLAKR